MSYQKIFLKLLTKRPIDPEVSQVEKRIQRVFEMNERKIISFKHIPLNIKVNDQKRYLFKELRPLEDSLVGKRITRINAEKLAWLMYRYTLVLDKYELVEEDLAKIRLTFRPGNDQTILVRQVQLMAVKDFYLKWSELLNERIYVLKSGKKRWDNDLNTTVDYGIPEKMLQHIYHTLIREKFISEIPINIFVRHLSGEQSATLIDWIGKKKYLGYLICGLEKLIKPNKVKEKNLIYHFKVEGEQITARHIIRYKNESKEQIKGELPIAYTYLDELLETVKRHYDKH